MSYNSNNKYVKFIKGSSGAFSRLPHKDENTLYFITDDNTKELSLYLGNVLISDGDSSFEAAPTNLKDLLDVALKNNLTNRDLLIFQGDKWTNISLEELTSYLDIPVMQAPTENEPGKSGLVPVSTWEVRNNFLRADGTWVDVVQIINQTVGSLVDNAPEAFNTLKEIADWIEKDESGTQILVGQVGSLDNSVKNLESNLSQLQDKVNGILNGEDLDLSQYVKTADFVKIVGNLSDLNNYTEDAEINIVNELNVLDQILTWQSLIEN